MGALEFNVRNLMNIRHAISHYCKMKKILKNTNVRQLFTKYRLREHILFDDGTVSEEKSNVIYWKLLRCKMESCNIEYNTNQKRKWYKDWLKKDMLCASGYCLKNKKDHKMYRCKRCQFVKYCSKKCQKLDWIHHKLVCKTL